VCVSGLFSTIVNEELLRFRRVPYEPPRLFLHAPIEGLRRVIPSEKMQEAVRKELRDLLKKGAAPSLGLFSCGGNGYDDVAEEKHWGFWPLSLEHPERKDVGWAIFLSIDSIELLDLCVGG